MVNSFKSMQVLALSSYKQNSYSYVQFVITTFHLHYIATTSPVAHISYILYTSQYRRMGLNLYCMPNHKA